jgi:hypothetical protein
VASRVIMPKTPTRRIDDRIRDLCTRVASAPENEMNAILSELQTTIHEYTRRTQNRLSATVLSWRTYRGERRKA